MIPVNEPLLDDVDLQNVTECIREGWVSSAGKMVDRFEAAWASYCGRSEGIAVANGTAALQLAVAALGLSEGDEVIIPTFTIISCAQAVVYAGARPVLVDADPKTWCMDPEQIRARVTSRTRAIMAVHIYGHPADMDAIAEVADEHGLPIIEDAAEAHGAEYKSTTGGMEWRRAGSFGLSSCFSFYANKLITTGEGGMVVTDDQRLADRLRRLRNLCFGTDHRFRHTALGHNYRLTNMQAALAVGQVDRIGSIVERKRSVAHRYSTLLADIDQLELPPEEAWAKSVYWVFGILLKESAGMDAGELARRLAAKGIDTRPFFLGMHQQPALVDRGYVNWGHFPVSERLSTFGLYLPSGLAITESQIDAVSEAVHEVLA